MLATLAPLGALAAGAMLADDSVPWVATLLVALPFAAWVLAWNMPLR